MNNIIITNPTFKDIDIMWKWGDENWQMWGDAKNKWFSKESLNVWLQDPEDDVLLVARDGEKLVGMCMTNVIRDWAFCFGLFVEEGYRSKGIGKKLFEETEKQLADKGISSYSLLVDTKNLDAVRFYQREGFLKGFEFYIMTKDLQ